MFQNFTKGDDIPQTASCRVEFDSNSSSDPDGLVDSAGVVDTTVNTNGLDHVSTGILLVTLAGNYRRVRAHVEIRDATPDMSVRAYCTDVDSAGAYVTPTVKVITTTTSTGAVLDTNNMRHVLDLELSP